MAGTITNTVEESTKCYCNQLRIRHLRAEDTKYYNNQQTQLFPDSPTRTLQPQTQISDSYEDIDNISILVQPDLDNQTVLDLPEITIEQNQNNNLIDDDQTIHSNAGSYPNFEIPIISTAVNYDSQLREFYNYNVQEVKEGSASEVAIVDVNSSNVSEFLVEQNVMEFDFPEFEHNETWSTMTSNTENLIDEELAKQKDQSESTLPNDFDIFSILDSSLFDQIALPPEKLQQNAVLLQPSSEPTTCSKKHALCLEEKKGTLHILNNNIISSTLLPTRTTLPSLLATAKPYLVDLSSSQTFNANRSYIKTVLMYLV
ncbi:hypothetical protein RN001_003554 [Aquatica leii]|uniref:Uncharacterized protein n=1 Tax=Aquatica leii TaxID=1421715 RepID=A0AAN7QP62_9COLE|nr:hypothetical protein RN001_003554 [Aquatica leii]